MKMIDWLYSLQSFGIKLGLDNIRALLEVLDRPDRAFRSIIVGGTNGKGSVTAMLHAMLEISGAPAGLFTSPHLVRPNERIRIGPDDISDEALDRRLSELRSTIEASLLLGRLQAHPSFFEVITAVALESFREERRRVAVLEVGLGGRLDATNAVDADLSVVVGIDLDHTKSLGPTLERIATEKAGIIKPGKPLISGALRPEAVTVLRETCRERDAPWIDARAMTRLVSEDGDTFTLATDRKTYPDLRLSLAGRHQIDNARVALTAFETISGPLAIDLDPDAVRTALAQVRWPGRLQWMRRRPEATDLLFDGAHNPAGMGSLVDYLQSRGEDPPVVLFGAMQGKLLDEMLGTLAPHAGPLIVTRPAVRRAADPSDLADHARRQGFRYVSIVDDPADGLALATELAGPNRYVLVTGSLYLVGEVLGLLERQPTPGPVAM